MSSRHVGRWVGRPPDNWLDDKKLDRQGDRCSYKTTDEKFTKLTDTKFETGGRKDKARGHKTSFVRGKWIVHKRREENGKAKSDGERRKRSRKKKRRRRKKNVRSSE